MRIVFFGTPKYVLPILESLHKNFKDKSGESPISCVVTQKPKPQGRKKILEYSAVDRWAHKKNIPIFFNPMNVIKENIEADIGILASFGQIIPKEVINYLPNGILNIHPSLLPEHKGASPVQATIIEGKTTTGVSIIKLDEKLDHGPIIGRFEEEVKSNDTTESLRDRLFLRSSDVLNALLPTYIQGKITPRDQKHTNSSFTKQLNKSDAFIPPKYMKAALDGSSLKDNWEMPFIKDYSQKPTPTTIERFIRAMAPWPIAWTTITIGSNEKRIKLIKAHMENEKLVLDEVQLEGKNQTNWKQFMDGYKDYQF